MKTLPDVFDILEEDANYRSIMKRLLRTSMEESFDAIVISEAKPGYPIVYVNPAFCRLTGYTPEEVMGQSPVILQGPKTDKKVIARLSADITKGELFHGRAINYRKDGTEFMMEWKIAPIRAADGELTHYLAIQKVVSG